MLTAELTSSTPCLAGREEATELIRLRQAVNASADVIFMTDADGIITFVNRQFEEAYGHRAADVVGRATPRILKGGSLTPEYYDTFWKRLRNGDTVRTELINRTKDGRPITIEAVISPTWNESRTAIAGFLAIQRDVTERKRSEDELRRKNLVLATEHNTTIDGILVVDEHDAVLSFNDQFVKMWDPPPDALASGKDEHLLLAVLRKLKDPQQFLDKVKHLYEHHDETSRDEIELSDGRTFDRYTAPMREADGRYYGRVWFFRDLTARKKAELALLQTREELRHEALYDRLTGLPNRTLLMERLERSVARAQRHRDRTFALLFVDLDNFKLVNDSLGHDVGDQLLVAFARRLESCLRQDDTLARLGGDEFVILTGDLRDPTDARQLASRIQCQLQSAFSFGSHDVVTTASIGIAESSQLGDGTFQDLLRDADTAMYRAKKRGKARCEVFTTQMHEETVERFQLEHDLRKAVERNEFATYYQPIVSVQSGEIVAFEALLRWRHPTRGVLAPAQFLSVADEMGLMIPIGEWMLRSACTDCRAWRSAGLGPIRVAVNVSPGQFRDPALAEMVNRVIRETGVDPQHVELELSEDIVLSSARSTIDQLASLTASGVRLSVDDFGVVHTSVRYLARFPIATLKIDQSFVRDLSVDRAGPIVMKALIELGHSLHLNVVIEGVETPEQESFVRECGCDAIQGFHVGQVIQSEQARILLSHCALENTVAKTLSISERRVAPYSLMLRISTPLTRRFRTS